MIAYADSSALVKRYVDEPGADTVRALDGVVTTSLAAVEVSSAIWRLHRMGELSASDAGVLADRARADLSGSDPAVVVVPPTTPVILEAARLTGTASLRAYDAVQLATALVARSAYPDLAEFACFDEALSGAAAAHGFAVLG